MVCVIMTSIMIMELSHSGKDPQARKSMGYVVQTDVATQKLALLFGAEGHQAALRAASRRIATAVGVLKGLHRVRACIQSS